MCIFYSYLKDKKSYFLHIGSLAIDLKTISNNIGMAFFNSCKIKNASFIFSDNIEHKTFNKYTITIIGEVENYEQVFNHQFKIEDIKLLKGSFALFIYDEAKVYFYISLDGKIPGYIIQQNEQLFITSELKAFRNTNYFSRKLIPIESYQYAYTSETSQTFSLMQDCNRIIPGVLYQIELNNSNKIKCTTVKSIISKPDFIDIDAAKQKLFNLLNDSIISKQNDKTPVAVALSGGVDSGTILGLLSKANNNIHTFSIGTEFGNEYDKAKISADFCLANHHTIFINDDDYREGILHAIFYNELCDPLYAEGYVAFYHFFKQASKYANTFFTGYGADLILGNMHKTQDTNNINNINAAWCKRTSWTGELSSYLANYFNCEMHFPFWNEDIINFGLSLPIEQIQNKENEKIILRTMSDEMQLTHKDIAWNKKTALTQGTSLDKLFSKILNIEHNNNYYFKSIFLYYLYKDFFVNDKNINEIDFNYLIQKTKNYVDNK